MAVMRLPVEKLNDWDTVKPASALTHQRMDALFFGVLLGYLYHFREPFLARVLGPARNRIALWIASALFLSSAVFLAGHRQFILIFGYTLMYLAFGAVLMLSLRARRVLPAVVEKPAGIVGGSVAYIGMYSYSIYLWHLAVLRWQPIFVEKVFHIQPGRVANYISYLIVSIGFGILMSRLIEYPILAIRDRLMPGAEAVPAKTTSTEHRQEADLLVS
jgi:peptidoglycan/LPS O-acetylase OafA/YrhL